MPVQKITSTRSWQLFDIATARLIEQQVAAALPPNTLMQRAGLAVARLTMALAPHARTVWLACGPGNNGGDGLEAAVHLQAWGKNPIVTWLGHDDTAPPDARAALSRARAAGVAFAPPSPAKLSPQDLCIDAIVGTGRSRGLSGPLAGLAQALRASDAPTLAVDVPSGLHADTGHVSDSNTAVQAQHTLSLLTLKQGLFTALGRDASGQVWFDDLGVCDPPWSPQATLQGSPVPLTRPHASHKGSYGDVAVVGGAPGMHGAAMLAASAALHGGAGRVYISWLDAATNFSQDSLPDVMFRHWNQIEGARMTVVCGCGGGQAVRTILPTILAHPDTLVLDADALNAVANDSVLQALLVTRGQRRRPTVLTPHPLEAARLLGVRTADVQSDRLAAAQRLAQRFGCVVVLKGSGTIVATESAQGNMRLCINPTGNGLLAIAGTGDVLAGMVAARLAAAQAPFEAACNAVYCHGWLADHWPANQALTASALAASQRRDLRTVEPAFFPDALRA